MPKSVHAGVRRAPAEISDAEDRDHALAAIEAVTRDYGSKWPKAAAKIIDDAETLLTFYDFPAEHWLHLKTTNPVESTFSTVRLRTRVTKARAPSRPVRRHSSCWRQPRIAGGRSRPTSGRARACRSEVRQDRAVHNS